MMPCARVTDMHLCPMVTPGVPPIPHVGGPVLPPGNLFVLVGTMPSAQVSSMCTCVGPPDVITMGSMTVLTGSLPQAKMLSLTSHGGSVMGGMPTVLVGG